MPPPTRTGFANVDSTHFAVIDPRRLFLKKAMDPIDGKMATFTDSLLTRRAAKGFSGLVGATSAVGVVTAPALAVSAFREERER